MGDETKARNSQDKKQNRITSVDVACSLNGLDDVRDLHHNKDAGTATDIPKMEPTRITSRGVESPVRDSDNTKDLSRYNSADNVRAAVREMKSPTKASNFDEDASTSKQQPKNSKDKGADSKSLRKMKRPDAPLKGPGPKRKKMSREEFYKGKLSNVVFQTYQPSSTSDSEISSIDSIFSSS